MAKLINLNLGWMTIGKKQWLPYDPTTDLAFGAKAKSFDLFTPLPDGQWQRESRRSKRWGLSRNCEPIFEHQLFGGIAAATLPNPHSVLSLGDRRYVRPLINATEATNIGFKVSGPRPSRRRLTWSSNRAECKHV
jgi:hypothetical protein